MTKDGKQIGVYEGASFWHTDVAYRDPPNSATIAYSVVTPTEPVELKVSNLAVAYDALPETMKHIIEDLQVLHHYGNRAYMDENSSFSAERLTNKQKSRERISTLSAQTPGHRQKISLCGRRKFVLKDAYAPGDLAAWDTYATLHKAALTRLSNDPRETRLLWRISVTGQNSECVQTA
jgi:taurine dioxygenase